MRPTSGVGQHALRVMELMTETFTGKFAWQRAPRRRLPRNVRKEEKIECISNRELDADHMMIRLSRVKIINGSNIIHCITQAARHYKPLFVKKMNLQLYAPFSRRPSAGLQQKAFCDGVAHANAQALERCEIGEVFYDL